MAELVTEFVEARVDESAKVLTVKFLDRISLDDFKKIVHFEYDMISKIS